MANSNLFSDLKLPDTNGLMEAGIAIGGDLSLPINKRLKLVKFDLAKWNAASDDEKRTTRLHTFASILSNLAEEIETDYGSKALEWDILMYGVYAALCGDLLDTAGKDVVISLPLASGSINPRVAQMFGDSFDRNAMTSALTIAVATKVAWWSCNHHLGSAKEGQKIGGYVLKCLNLKYAGRPVDSSSPSLAEVVHRLGHYYSTIKVLQIAGIKGLREITEALYIPAQEPLKLSVDSQLRFDGFPAGTAKIAVAHAGMSRLIKTSVAVICPDIEDLAELAVVHNDIKKNRVMYHMGAYHLTGQQRITRHDSIGNNCLGRVGTFINAHLKNSTLAKSPHIRNYKDMDDYQQEFETNLTTMKMQNLQAAANFTQDYSSMKATAAYSTLNDIANLFGVKLTSQQKNMVDQLTASGGSGAGRKRRRSASPVPFAGPPMIAPIADAEDASPPLDAAPSSDESRAGPSGVSTSSREQQSAVTEQTEDDVAVEDPAHVAPDKTASSKKKRETRSTRVTRSTEDSDA